jgi:glycosyltransferase involved in cell wall biosynthesis
VVAHHLFAQSGGGERLSAAVIDESIKRGVTTTIATISRFDPHEVFARFGLTFNGEVEEKYLIPFFLNAFGIYQKLFSSYPALLSCKRRPPDAIFIDNEFIEPLRPLQGRSRIICYIHFPIFLELQMQSTRPEKYNRFPWNLYWKPWGSIASKLIPKQNFADVVCCNSYFTKGYVDKLWNCDSIVIYPPVATSSFTVREKMRIVCCLGRITPEKRYEIALQAVSKTSGIRLEIIGGLAPAMRRYAESLQHLARQLEIHDRVTFRYNAPFSIIKSVLARSAVFLHTMKNEHFGIAPVEGMASGCFPIVHKSGGVWHDIVEEGRYGLGFEEADEIPDLIEKAMELQPKFEESLIERARRFDESVFRRKIFEIILDQ